MVAGASSKSELPLVARKILLHPADEPPVLSAGVATALRRIKLVGLEGLHSFQKAAQDTWSQLVRSCVAKQQELS